MAKSNYGPGIPADQPAELGNGLTRRESEFFADASETRGIYAGFSNSAPLFSAKGDRRETMTNGQTQGSVPFRVKGRR
jgi:hypothetical protein